jgi:hypothetical protein
MIRVRAIFPTVVKVGVAWVVAAALVLPLGCRRAQDAKIEAEPATQPAGTQSAEDVKLNAATLAKLDRLLPNTKFMVGWADILDYLQSVTGTKIVVPWQEVEAVGIDRNKAVTLDVVREKYSDGLSDLLDLAAGKPGVLTYRVEGGNIVIVVSGAAAATRPK